MDFGILGWSVIKMIKLTSVCCQRKIKHFALEFTGKYFLLTKGFTLQNVMKEQQEEQDDVCESGRSLLTMALETYKEQT